MDKKYGSDLFWAVMFFVASTAWNMTTGETWWMVSLGWLSWAAVLYFVTRIFLHWAEDRQWPTRTRLLTPIVASLAFVALAAYRLWFVSAPVYVYLAPSQGLFDGEQRAFVVKHVGPRAMENVEIAIYENSHPEKVEKKNFDLIGSSGDNPLAPKYLWFTPSTPWNEEYTIVTTDRQNSPVRQQLTVRSQHRGFSVSSRVEISGFSWHFWPLLECKYEACDELMRIDQTTQHIFEPKPKVIQMPDGSVVDQGAVNPAPSAPPEAESDLRRLSEWQRQQIIGEMRQFSGRRVLILATSGSNTWKYADDFRDVFREASWKVTGPLPAPPRDEGITDVWISVNAKWWNRPLPRELAALRDILVRTGVKHSPNHILDPNVPEDTIVLWVGAKSPEGRAAADCGGPEYKPRENMPKPCSIAPITPKPLPPIPGMGGSQIYRGTDATAH